MTDRLTLVYNFCVILVCKGMPSMPLKSGIDIDIDRFSCSCLIRYTAVTSFTAFFLGGGCGGGGGGWQGEDPALARAGNLCPCSLVSGYKIH